MPAAPVLNALPCAAAAAKSNLAPARRRPTGGATEARRAVVCVGVARPRGGKRGVQPRRRPTGAPGRDIVEAILGAAWELLSQRGLDAMTTNAVAARAGVSIGSVYRYYPSKEAIVAELARRLWERTRALVVGLVTAHEALTLDELIERCIRPLASEELGEASARRVLATEVPPRWMAETLAGVRSELGQLVARTLEARGVAREGGDSELRAFVLVTAVQGALTAAITHRPESLRDGRLAAELIDLVRRYVAPA